MDIVGDPIDRLWRFVLQRLRTRFGEATHDYQDVGQFMIRATLADAQEPIVVLGDSVTEMAPVPTVNHIRSY